MARRDKPTKGAHALGGEIAVVRFHPEQLPQRGRHEGTPASNTAKKGVRKGCHRQTSGLSVIAARLGKAECWCEVSPTIMLHAQTDWVVTFRIPATVRMTGPGPRFCARLLAFCGNRGPNRNLSVSNSDQLFGGGRAIINLEKSIPAFSFRSLN